MPSTLCSDASFASFQCLFLYSARHQHDSFLASPRTAAGTPTIGSSIPDNRQQASRQSAAGIPDSPPPHKPGRHVRVAALQSIMEPYFTPHLYLYLYIYKYIYKYKIFLWYLLLLGKQLQHCNAARNIAGENLIPESGMRSWPAGTRTVLAKHGVPVFACHILYVSVAKF